jgi:hypothetical protein
MSTVVMDSLINNNNNNNSDSIVKPIISLKSTVVANYIFLIQPTIRRYVILTELETGGTFANGQIFSAGTSMHFECNGMKA